MDKQYGILYATRRTCRYIGTNLLLLNFLNPMHMVETNSTAVRTGANSSEISTAVIRVHDARKRTMYIPINQMLGYFVYRQSRNLELETPGQDYTTYM